MGCKSHVGCWAVWVWCCGWTVWWWLGWGAAVVMVGSVLDKVGAPGGGGGAAVEAMAGAVATAWWLVVALTASMVLGGRGPGRASGGCFVLCGVYSDQGRGEA